MFTVALQVCCLILRPLSRIKLMNTVRDTYDHRFASLYLELHRVARHEANRYGSLAQLSTTTLLHETYLDLANGEPLAVRDQGGFIAYAARAMRGLVIDRVRARTAAKRGGNLSITSLESQDVDDTQDPKAPGSSASEISIRLRLVRPTISSSAGLSIPAIPSSRVSTNWRLRRTPTTTRYRPFCAGAFRMD